MLGDRNDVFFIESDQGTEHRHRADLVGRRQAGNRLACHLADALAGNQAEAACLFRNPFRNSHHVTAHDDSQLVMRALFIDIKLDVCKVHHIQVDGTCIPGHLFRQFHHLLLRALTGIGRRMEIDRVDLDAALCHHIACHRAVDAAGEQKHGFSVCAHRHTARTGNHIGIQVNLLTDLHMQHQIRLVYIHPHIREGVQNLRAKLRVHLHGSHGIGFAGTLCVNLEGFVAVPAVPLFQIGHHVLSQLLKALVFQNHHRADSHDTEYPAHGVHRVVVVIFSLSLRIDTALLLGYMELSFHLF